MKHRPPGMLISKSTDGFLTFKMAEGFCKRTIDSTEYFLRRWLKLSGDQDVS